MDSLIYQSVTKPTNKIPFQIPEEKNSFITMQCDRLQGGISKIDEASEQIDQLRVIVSQQKAKVAAASEKCHAMLVSIDSNTKQANEKKSEASVKSVEVEVKGKQIAIEKGDAEIALADAMPALEEARKALSDLDKADITEIRSFASPAEQIRVVCECVAILRGYKEIDWKTAKGMMSDVSFLKSLMEMDCEALTGKQIAACRAHMKSASKMDRMQEISKAGYGLLRFVLAVTGFYDVFKEVKPKIERVRFLEAEQQTQVRILNALNAEILRLETQLDELNRQYAEAMKEMRMLTEMMQQAEKRLVSESLLRV